MKLPRTHIGYPFRWRMGTGKIECRAGPLCGDRRIVSAVLAPFGSEAAIRRWQSWTVPICHKCLMLARREHP